MKTLVFAVLTALTFGGCSTKDFLLEHGEPYLREYGLHDDSTFACVDMIGRKQECPAGLLQRDFDTTFLIVRVCFGFADSNSTVPDGMRCLKRNFIADLNYTEYAEE